MVCFSLILSTIACLATNLTALEFNVFYKGGEKHAAQVARNDPFGVETSRFVQYNAFVIFDRYL